MDETNRFRMQRILECSKIKVIDMLKKFVTPEMMLEDYEATYLVGTLLEIYDDLSVAVIAQAETLDKLMEMSERSYNGIKELTKQVEDIKNQNLELKREMIKKD